MPLYKDAQLVLHTDYLVAAWAVDGYGEDDGQTYLHLLLQLDTKRERVGVLSPTPAARDAALQAIGALMAACPAVYEDGETN